MFKKVVTALSILMCWSTAVRAQETWDSPHPGMEHMFKITGKPLRIHGLVVDLCAPGTGARATAPGEKKQKTSTFGASVGAQGAINGDFFSYQGYGTTGLAMGNGEMWSGTSDSGWQALVAFGKGHAHFSPEAEVFSPAWWTRDIVSGFAQIMKDGEAISSYDCGGHFCQEHPRTAVGLSKDRRKLYMLVVDGRTKISLGVTLKELAVIMKDLGAYDAVNLDGGGSTTMWIQGPGVVNDPSDDAGERVVANHLAAFADGDGQPSVCNEWPPEQVWVDAGLFDAAGSTDIDGDGLGDMCGRAAAGLYCHLSGNAELGEVVQGPNPELSDDLGWGHPEHYGTIHMGDINGDSMADVCARGNAGMRCWLSTGDGFSGDAITGPEWSDANGWQSEKYFSTIRMADVNGDGMADLCGRGPDGIRCHLATGTGFDAGVPGPELSDASGWGKPQYYGTIRTGDFNADGLHDICARAAKGVLCWPSTGDGFGAPVNGPAWSDDSGAWEMRYWQTLRMVDVNGDFRDDLCMRDSEGILCALSDGAGFSQTVAGPGMADANGWADQTNFLPIRWGDINGDGMADVCARADKEMMCWPSLGDGFGPGIDGPAFSDDQQWFMAKYYNTVRLTDLNGDGMDDLCGRGKDGVICYLSDGNGFPTMWTGPGWSDSSGWGAIPYWSSMRAQTPRVIDPCLYPWACEPMATESIECGQCGESVRTCSATCGWSDWSACGPAEEAQSACDDGNGCTDDLCGTSGDCEHSFNTQTCDDGDPCTVSACQDGTCMITGKVAGCCNTLKDCLQPQETCVEEMHVCLSVLCTTCSTHDDCGAAGNLCLALADGSFGCGMQCEPGDCPDGYDCVSFAPLPSQCFPSAQVCACGPPDHEGCLDGDFWSFDNCGSPGALVEDCESRGCTPDGCCPPGTWSDGGECVTTGPQPGSDVVDSDVVENPGAPGNDGDRSGGCSAVPSRPKDPAPLLLLLAVLALAVLARAKAGGTSCNGPHVCHRAPVRASLPLPLPSPSPSPSPMHPGPRTVPTTRLLGCLCFLVLPSCESAGVHEPLDGPVIFKETLLDDDFQGQDAPSELGLESFDVSPEEESASTLPGPCLVVNDFGECPGMLVKTADESMVCVGPVPSIEACNGLDDDCNGKTDENACTDCGKVDACEPGAVESQTQPCDPCTIETRTRTCDEKCRWGDWSQWSQCEPSGGECVAGDVDAESESCGNCGERTRSRTCTESCAWGDWGEWSECGGQGACAPGTQDTQKEPCGNCGTRSHARTCGEGCQWGSWGGWSDCAGQGACSPGTAQDGACDPCSQQLCQANCQWGGCALKPGSQCEWLEGKHWKCCASGKWHFCLPPKYGCKWSDQCVPCTGCGC